MLFYHFCSICPLIAYFLKKNYSLWQNILKNMRVWERSLTSVPIGVYLALIWVGTWLGTGSRKGLWRFAEERVTGRCTGLWCPASGQFTGGELAAKEWPDAGTVFSQRPVRRSFSVRSIRKMSRLGDRTLAVSGRCPPDASIAEPTNL